MQVSQKKKKKFHLSWQNCDFKCTRLHGRRYRTLMRTVVVFCTHFRQEDYVAGRDGVPDGMSGTGPCGNNSRCGSLQLPHLVLRSFRLQGHQQYHLNKGFLTFVNFQITGPNDLLF